MAAGGRWEALTGGRNWPRVAPVLAGLKPRRTDPVIHRVRDLRPARRWLLVAAIALGMLPVVISGISAYRDGWTPVGDNALIALRTLDVPTVNSPLTGQPSTSEFYGGEPTDHPGPMEFWILLAPLALLGPSAGMLLGAVLINGAAIAATGFVAYRRQGLAFALWSLALVSLYCWSIRANILHDPISSSIVAVSAVLLLFLAWSIVLRDWALLPLAAVTGSFVFQSHLSSLGHNGLLSVAVAVAAVVLVVQRRRRSDAEAWTAERGQVMRWGGWAALAVALLWLPVLLDQVAGNGNVGAIWRSFRTNRGNAHGGSWALDRVATALGPVPIFARQVRLFSLDHLDAPTGIAGVVAFLPLLAAVALAVVLWRRQREAALLLATGLVALASGAYSAASLPDRGGAEQQMSALRWMWVTGLFLWLGVGWGAWSLLARRRRARAAPVVVPALAVLLLVTALAATVSYRTDGDRDSPYVDGVRHGLPLVRARLGDAKTVAFTYQGVQSLLTVGPPFALDAARRGRTIYVPAPMERVYGSFRIADATTRPDAMVWLRDGSYQRPDAGMTLAAVVPADTKEVLDGIGPTMAGLRDVITRSGGLQLTAAGRRLQARRGDAGTPEDRALSVLLDDREALLHTGLLRAAMRRGLIRDPGFPAGSLDRLAAGVAFLGDKPYVAVFTT